MAVEVISTMLGVPESHRQQIRHWTDLMLHRESGDPSPTREGMEGALEQVGYFLELIAEKRAHPGDDMISRLTEVEVEGCACMWRGHRPERKPREALALSGAALDPADVRKPRDHAAGARPSGQP